MLTVEVSSAERAAGALSSERLAQARRALLDDGIVVLNNAVDPDHIRTLCAKMLEDVAAILERKDVPFNWNSGNLQQGPPPIEPYLFRDVLVNELAIQVATSVIGPRIKNNFYSGNTALPSEQRQPVHADMGHLWPGTDVATPPFGIVVNFPMVDFTEENGATEIWPGTHKDTSISWYDPIEIPEDVLERRRALCPPERAIASVGSLVMRDIRLWHAGMPNRTSSPRPMAALIFWADWMNAGKDLQFPRGTEPLFEHPTLVTLADFVDGPIPYILHGGAYSYTPEESA